MKLSVTVETEWRPEPLLRAVSKAKEAVCTAQAERVADAARRLISRRGRASRPGEPPTDRSGRLRRHIQSAWDGAAGRAIAGPAIASTSHPLGDGRPMGSTIPAVLERGGQVTNVQVRLRGRWRNDTNRLRRVAPSARRRSVTHSIAPRPYMAPALAAEAPRFPGLFLNSIRGGG